MKIALMQPYFMPYLGYFQLIHAVDKFIFFEDTGFIKKGWIHRNNILLNKKRHPFGLPIQQKSSFKSIKDTLVAEKPYNWQKKLSKKIWQEYHDSPFFDDVFWWIDELIQGAAGRSISDVAIESIEKTMHYIGFEKPLVRSFNRYNNSHLKLSDRIIDICRQEKATTYVNAIGGHSFLSKDYFLSHNTNLMFIKPILTSYIHKSPQFVAGLSIIDILMHNDPSVVKAMLGDYSLI